MMNVIGDMIENVRPSTWLGAFALLAVSLVVLLLAQSLWVRGLLTDRLARATGLEVPASIQTGLGRGAARRLVGAATGGLVGLAAATYVVYYVGADRAQPATFFLLGTYVIAACMGRAVVSGTGALSSVPSTIRVANARRRSVKDYLPRWGTLATRITVALSALIVTILSLLPIWGNLAVAVFPSAFSMAALVTALAIVALFVYELGARWIAQSPQQQDSELALAWDDVLRSLAIRDLAAAAWLLGIFGAFFGFGEIAFASSPMFPSAISSAAAYNIVGALSVLAAASLLLFPGVRTHSILRLHPELVRSGVR